MQVQDIESSGSGARESGTLTGSIAGAANDAYEKAAEFTGDAAGKVRQAAGEAAANTTSQLKDLLDNQVGTGAAMLGDLAHSVHRAADDLDRSSPLVGGLFRNVAERMSGYADELEGQTSDELLRAAKNLTQRQPALVFGLAALAGFFVFRAMKNAPSAIKAPSIQPAQHGFDAERDRERANMNRPGGAAQPFPGTSG